MKWGWDFNFTFLSHSIPILGNYHNIINGSSVVFGQKKNLLLRASCWKWVLEFLVKIFISRWDSYLTAGYSTTSGFCVIFCRVDIDIRDSYMSGGGVNNDPLTFTQLSVYFTLAYRPCLVSLHHWAFLSFRALGCMSSFCFVRSEIFKVWSSCYGLSTCLGLPQLIWKKSIKDELFLYLGSSPRVTVVFCFYFAPCSLQYVYQ